jgi:hypothetical protein
LIFARVVSFVAIYSCSSIRNPKLEPLLGKAMASGACSSCDGSGATLAIPGGDFLGYRNTS